MLLFASGAKTGAHHSTFILAALANSHAAKRGLRETSVVLRKFKMSLRLPWAVVSAQAEISVQLVGQNNFARIHLPLWIPKSLEPAKGLRQFGAEHLRKQFGPRLTVPMFAGKGAAVRDNQVRCFFHKPAEFLEASVRLKIEADAVVDAAVTKVPVHHAAIVVRLGQLAEFPQISAELLGSDCRVFPSFPRRRLPRNVRNRAQCGLPDLPGLSRLPLVGEEAEARWMGGSAEGLNQSARLRFRLARCLRAELCEKPSSALRE